MESALSAITHNVALVIEAMALVIIAFGSIEAFIASARTVAMHITLEGETRRAIWLRYARWLIAGLTFQLAADVIDTAIAPTWDEIGRLGAIAAIRTFLNFFLERDLEEVRARQRVGSGNAPAEERVRKDSR